MRVYRIFNCDEMEYVKNKMCLTLGEVEKNEKVWRDDETGEWYMIHNGKLMRLKFGFRREPV